MSLGDPLAHVWCHSSQTRTRRPSYGGAGRAVSLNPFIHERIEQTLSLMCNN